MDCLFSRLELYSCLQTVVKKLLQQIVQVSDSLLTRQDETYVVDYEIE